MTEKIIYKGKGYEVKEISKTKSNLMESVIDKSDISHSIEELRRLKLRLAETREQRLRFEADNRIEFFGLVNEERGFKGPNPLQKKLLEAWDNPHYKLFTYTGGNRIGKTTIGIIIGLSTLFGKWLWNGRDLIIPHHHPRKVRLIGQDWEKHIKAVLEPELHKWWPKNRAVRIKKNNFGAESFWVDEKTGSSLELMCLRPDQRVMMADGTEKSIESINKGALIKCSKGNTTVKNKIESYADKFLHISTFNGREIVCSENHGILTVNGWKKARDISISDELKTILPDFTPTENIEDWKLILLGVLIGDGYIKQWCAEWTCFSDELIQWVKNKLPADLKLHKIPKRNEVYRISQKVKRNNNPLKTWMEEIGIWGCGSGNKFIPDCIFRLSKEKTGVFLKALFSTDGTFSVNYHQISYSSRSKRLVDDLKRLLRHIDVIASTSEYYIKSVFDGYDCSGIVYICRFGGRDNIRNFSRFSGFVGKKQSWNNFYSKYTNINKKSCIRKEKIRSICILDGGKSYDLEVEDACHDYIVDGLIVHNSNKQESELHEGWSGDLILYDEPPRREIRIANARGLIDRQGRELFCMTLLKEAWVDRDVIKAVNQDGTPDTTVFNIHGDISANIGFGITQMGVEQFAKTLTEEEKDVRLKGIPSYMSGLIYSKFNRQTHLRKRFKIPLDWLVDISIDFHPSKKWAVLFVATDKKNFKYCIDEIHENGSWKAISEEIVRRIKTNHYRVEAPIIIDPLAKGDEQSDLNEESVFEKMQNLFAAYGLRMSAASKDKDGGIHLVKDLLMTENEMPSLFFFNDLKQTIKELEGYMIDPDTNKPQKYDDDFMECLYRIALLNTQWYDMADDEIFTYKHEVETRNAVTGY